MPYIQFLGAAGTVTGSKHLVNFNDDPTGKTGLQILIDCGLFQGQKEWRERNWSDPPMPVKEIDAVILTHAHLDHIGWVPRLVKQGYRGPILATPATVELAAVLLADSGHLQEEDAKFHNKKKSSKHDPALPLYTMEDAQEAMQYFKPVNFGETMPLQDGVTFRFVRASHIVGSSMVEISAVGKRLLFTGDIGRVRDSEVAPGRVVHSGPTEGETADVLVMESTYGNRLHPHTDPRPEMAKLITASVKRGGCIVVPAFAVERTQKFLFMIKELMESGAIPRIPVFADSPMAIDAVKIFLKHTEEFSSETQKLIEKYGSPERWDNFHFAVTPADSKKINDSKYPCIIVSSNGMCMGGRIQHHLLQRLPDPKNLILFIGFQAPGTRGRQIKDGAKQVKIFGDVVDVRAQVAAVEQFSDHADTPELLEWLRTFKNRPEMTYLVHGEPESCAALQKSIQQELQWRVQIAEYKQKVPIAGPYSQQRPADERRSG